MKDDQSLKRIDRCPVEVGNFDTVQRLDENGIKFKIGPRRFIDALRWKLKATPADVELVLVRERMPQNWVSYVVTMLFGALYRANPERFELLRASQ